jgi:hypothetical protein
VHAGHAPYVPAQASEHPASKAQFSCAHKLPLPPTSDGEVQNLLAGMHDVPHRELEKQFADTQASLLNSPTVQGQQRLDTLADIRKVTCDILLDDANYPMGLERITLDKPDRRQDMALGSNAVQLLNTLERYQALGRALIVRNQFIAAANLDTPSSPSQQSGPSVGGGNMPTGDLVQRFIDARKTIETALHQHGLGFEALILDRLGALQQGVTLTDLSGHTITINTLSAAQLTEFRDLGRALCDRQINGTPSMSGGGTTSAAAQRPTSSTASLLGNVPVGNTSSRATSAVTASSSSSASVTLKDVLSKEFVQRLAGRFNASANQNVTENQTTGLRRTALQTLGKSLGAHNYRLQPNGQLQITMPDCLDYIFAHCKLSDRYSVDTAVKNVQTLAVEEAVDNRFTFVAFPIVVDNSNIAGNSNRPNVNETVWVTKQSNNTITDIRVVPKGSDASSAIEQLKKDMLRAAIHAAAYPSTHASTKNIPDW